MTGTTEVMKVSPPSDSRSCSGITGGKGIAKGGINRDLTVPGNVPAPAIKTFKIVDITIRNS